MKIAGVSVNLECLPTKEQLVRMALSQKRFQNCDNALELINKEIKESGLYRNISKGFDKSVKPNTKAGK